MRPVLLAAALSLALASLPGCAAPPPIRVDTAAGTVRGADRLEVVRVASRLDTFHREVRRRLPRSRDEHLEVWIEERLDARAFGAAPEGMEGFVDRSRRRIHLRSGGECIEQTLAHELVHALLDGSWAGLPAVIEEGLCEFLAAEIAGGCAVEQRRSGLLAAALYLGDVSAEVLLVHAPRSGPEVSATVPARFERAGAPALAPMAALELASSRAPDPAVAAQLEPGHYGLGMWLVERIAGRVGLQGLHALVREAAAEGLDRVPSDRLVALADAGPPEGWQRRVLGTFDEEDLIRLVGENRRGVLDAAAGWLAGTAAPEMAADDVIARSRVVFRFDPAGPQASLLDAESFRGELRWELERRRGDR